MYIFTKTGALQTFFWLMAVDGAVCEEELGKLDEIGRQLLGDELYAECRDGLLEHVNAKMPSAENADDYYDIISENVDRALSIQETVLEEGVPSRVLLWNLILMAYANGEFDPREKRLLRHICRMAEVEESVLFEMVQLLLTLKSISDELDRLQVSTLSYVEIRAQIEELIQRRETVNRCLTELLADEMVTPVVAMEVKDDFIDVMRGKIKTATKPVTDKVKEAAQPVVDKVKSAAQPVVDKVKTTTKPVVDKVSEGARKAFDIVREKVKPKNANPADETAPKQKEG